MSNLRKDGSIIRPEDPDHLNPELMEGFYQDNLDPWGNKGLYIKWFKGMSESFKDLIDKNIRLVDLGCGGGNVLEGLVSEFTKLTDKIKVSGCDISETAISSLNGSEIFRDLKFQEFKVGDLQDPRSVLPIEDNTSLEIIHIYSIVDVMYYLKKRDWHEIAREIMDIIPMESYVIIADSLKMPQYRHYYRDRYKVGSDYEIDYIDSGRSETFVSEHLLESGRWFRRYLNWSIYHKIQKENSSHE